MREKEQSSQGRNSFWKEVTVCEGKIFETFSSNDMSFLSTMET